MSSLDALGLLLLQSVLTTSGCVEIPRVGGAIVVSNEVPVTETPKIQFVQSETFMGTVQVHLFDHSAYFTKLKTTPHKF